LPNGELSLGAPVAGWRSQDGEATRGSSGLLGGAFRAPTGKTLAEQLAVERRVHAPLNMY
jgi:hypothetical protein